MSDDLRRRALELAALALLLQRHQVLLQKRLCLLQRLQQQCGWITRPFGQGNVGDEAALLVDAIPAFVDTPFPVLQMLAARADLGLFPHQKPQQLFAFLRAPGCMQPREVDLDIAFGQEDAHRRSHVGPLRHRQRQ